MTNAATIGVVGYHNTGKTTLICKLIERLTERGYSVSTIKNIPKDGFSMDVEGTDTWRHGKSGAGLVVASTSGETTFIVKNGMPFEDILRTMDNMTSPDVILVEGHKTEDIPKIVLGDIEMDGGGRRYDPDADDFEDILDYVTEAIEIARVYAKLPKMDCGKCGCDDCMEMAEAIVRGEKTIADCVVQEGLVSVTVGGEAIPMGPFVQDIVSKTISGMVSSLKGVDREGTGADIIIEIKHAEK
ncbi:MAG: putative molybdopterin-guanine dinucleotide biosynthesis adapter protein [ANME-2 cluster archaeon]|nr:putative molybdopterin-guanine dinucleotide biosynthesis adapter protein [ANME-2 cluster archaeon]